MDLQTLGEITILTCFNTEHIWEFYAFSGGHKSWGSCHMLSHCLHTSVATLVTKMIPDDDNAKRISENEIHLKNEKMYE